MDAVEPRAITPPRNVTKALSASGSLEQIGNNWSTGAMLSERKSETALLFDPVHHSDELTTKVRRRPQATFHH